MKLLFLFLDGIGLGADNVRSNPFAAVHMPNLESISNGHRLVKNLAPLPLSTERATILSLDACLGIEGRPQSASGQATLLTGENVPALIGHHYGPKPNAKIRALLENGNLFSKLKLSGRSACFVECIPRWLLRVH